MGYKGLYKMVKKLGAMPALLACPLTIFDRTDEGHDFGTTITRKGLDPLYGKELMGIKSDKVYGRYTQGTLFPCGGITLTYRRSGKMMSKFYFYIYRDPEMNSLNIQLHLTAEDFSISKVNYIIIQKVGELYQS